ncbi:MAG: hypothetical protein UT32_C0004G0035 [Parcubacteria group bacterium GW2011_GWC2_39_14]|nr:MAG: hypothetical protein UT32_C0004G0035 [Parcubacteria group bacterium GW2011_GWC2_39_14]KKR54879.1 MAG: hypothetical protein UT91_C0008G0035 [Parcubacteria group bacterium GW2011_GWA2_40_23]
MKWQVCSTILGACPQTHSRASSTRGAPRQRVACQSTESSATQTSATSATCTGLRWSLGSTTPTRPTTRTASTPETKKNTRRSAVSRSTTPPRRNPMSAQTHGHPEVAPRMPKGQRCDHHSDRPAVARVLKASDGDSRTYADLCEECYGLYQDDQHLDELARLVQPINEEAVVRKLDDAAIDQWFDSVPH